MSEHSRQKIRHDVLSLLRNNGHRAFRPKEIAKRLGYTDNKTYRVYREVLSEMDEQRLVARIKGGRYTFKARPTRLEGILRVNPAGFGFVEIEGMREDLYVREANMKNALDGDRVLVAPAAPTRGDKRREVEVLEVVERSRKQAVGTLRIQGRIGYVEPDDRRLVQDVFVAEQDLANAREGDKVVVSIDEFANRHGSPQGHVLEVLGSADHPSVRVLSLALSMDVRAGFPEDAIREAEAVYEVLPKSEIDRRMDLREKMIFTIDPIDAQDFDDAIHAEELTNGNLELGVHIADVSHYVPTGSALDREAYARGTSVYLVDRVLPMLPEKLSNRVCSLRPGEDKLTFSCIMEVTPRGRVERYEIRESVIRSAHRLTYEAAQEIMDGQRPDHPLVDVIRHAAELAEALTRKRLREGSIDFDIPEVRVVLDDVGDVKNIQRKERTAANRLIEEFMLLANRTVAREIALRKPRVPFVYRVHDRPDAERIQQLADYVRAFGYRLKLTAGSVDSAELNALLEHVKGTPEEPVIEEAAVRAMAKARYQVENIGHYGLGFDDYTHFTSPIRRYPDLMVHRLLKHYSAGGRGVDAEELDEQCQRSSEREKAAVEAERESVKLKQVEFMQQHVGDRFSGVVSGVTKFGVFVELSEVLVEGMVHVRDLDDDYYEYDERTYRLIGQYTGKSYRLGDQVETVVAAANPERRSVDLVFAG